MTKGELAKQGFTSGLNCAQAVAAAFCDEMELDEELVKRLTIGFGGGVGRLREVCGAVLGMSFVISAIYSGDKASIYPRVQEVANEYKKQNGSIVCRELLGLDKGAPLSPVPEARTSEYYKKRPCAELVQIAGDILEAYIKANPYKI